MGGHPPGRMPSASRKSLQRSRTCSAASSARWANLEAEDTTPALRRRIATRIAELEESVEDHRRQATALAQEAADAPPTAADLASALHQLPLIERLPELPQPEIRDLFDSLRLQIAFQPADASVDVEVALFA